MSIDRLQRDMDDLRSLVVSLQSSPQATPVMHIMDVPFASHAVDRQRLEVAPIRAVESQPRSAIDIFAMLELEFKQLVEQ